MHYKPNEMALNLRMKRNNTIGVIVQVVHYFFSSIVSGIEEVTFSEGLTHTLQVGRKLSKETQKLPVAH